MSIDIRIHFEGRMPEGWAPLWPPMPDPKRWPDLLADYLAEDGSTLAADAVAEGADHEAIAAYLGALGPEEAICRHGDRHILWLWPLPGDAPKPRFLLRGSRRNAPPPAAARQHLVRCHLVRGRDRAGGWCDRGRGRGW